MSDTDVPKLPDDVRAVAEYLHHTRHGLKLRAGVMDARRIAYFKGRYHFHDNSAAS